MKKFFTLYLLILIASSQLQAQTIFISQLTGGDWELGTTWDQTACGSGCTAGLDYPGPNDYAIVLVQSGSSINIARGKSFIVKDLLIVGDVANIIRCSGIVGTAALTINGQLSGVLADLSGYAEPTANVFQGTANNLNLIFTGSNLDDPIAGAVITSWGYNSPIYKTSFNPGVGNTVRVDNHSLRNSAVVQSGTLQVNAGQTIQDFSGVSQFIVNASATLNLLGAINGNGSTSSSFSTATINGTLTTGTSGYLNSSTFTLGATGTLNIGFNGANQTQGWWYQTTAPTTPPNINATSTVLYLAGAAQNVFATTYGNLSLSSSTAGVTKSLIGSGLTIQGNLTVGTNVTFSPSSQVDFIGTAAQSISGGGVLNFNGGLGINKSSETVTFNMNVSSTGIAITSGTLNLGDVNTSLSGATVTNAGTITSGTAGNLFVSGTNTFAGVGSTTLNNFTISSGPTNFNNSFTLMGNLTNSGSLSIVSTATVTFSGGAAQAISGNLISIGKIVVNKPSSTLSNNGNVELMDVLTMTTGTFDADGSGSGILTFNSDTNGDASIGVMAGGSITGNVTFERYFDNTIINRWRNLAFPVTGITYSALGSSITLNSGSLATYTETTPGNVDQGWNIISGASTILNSTNGHTAWMYNATPITISVRGPLLQNVPASPYNFGVTYFNDLTQPASEDGWNLVPNPFASPINWNNPGWVKTNVNGVIAVWDNVDGIYKYTSGGPNSLWDGVIAQGQSFWVQTNAASPLLTCSESVKVTNSNPAFYRTAGEEVNSMLAIGLKSGVHEDKTFITYLDEATPEFDGAFDAHKLKNAIFNLSTLTNEGLNLAVNVLPRSICTSSIKLNITNIEPGAYSINFEGLETFKNLNHVTLIDKFLNVTRIIESGNGYTFEVTSDIKSYGSERFQLVFDFADQMARPVIEKNGRYLVSSYKTENQWYYNDKPIEGATGDLITPTKNGTYHVVIKDGVCNMRSDPLTIEEVISRVFPNPASYVLKVDVQNLLVDKNNSGEILIHSMLGQLIRKEEFTNQDDVKEILVNDIKPGSYILTITTVNGIVLDKTKVLIK